MLPHPEEIEWTAEVNGAETTLHIENNAVLLDVLREKAGSLGTKRGCDMGTCGCCSVLIDGDPRLSCLTLATEAYGASITTVEGLSDGHHLHPIQQTFTEFGGSQCGFCTPGFLVVISALLSENSSPSDEEIIENPPSRSAKFRYAIKKTDFYNFDTDIEKQFRNYIEIENYGDKL